MVEQAKREQELQEQEWNKQNSKAPDLNALYGDVEGGDYSSMLTGTSGIDYSQLTLGKNSLLGSNGNNLGGR